MKQALVALALLALLLPAAARANGDPASDTLLTEQVFLPFEAPISKSSQDNLRKTVADANKKGVKLRVALIAFTCPSTKLAQKVAVCRAWTGCCCVRITFPSYCITVSALWLTSARDGGAWPAKPLTKSAVFTV